MDSSQEQRYLKELLKQAILEVLSDRQNIFSDLIKQALRDMSEAGESSIRENPPRPSSTGGEEVKVNDEFGPWNQPHQDFEVVQIGGEEDMETSDQDSEWQVAALESDREGEGLGLAAEEMPPPVQEVDDLLVQGWNRGASALHFRPWGEELEVRLKIEGVWHHLKTLSGELKGQVLARLKILGGLDLSERNRPQNGFFSWEKGETSLKIAIFTSATVEGETCTLRLLSPQDKSVPPLDLLGFTKPQKEFLREKINQPSGLILFTGPSDSGKMTRLYSLLAEINPRERNLYTVEKAPVYRLEGASQLRLTPSMDYGLGIRTAHRQEADVILTCLSDQNAGRAILNAALNGTLVLASFHAFTPARALLRLLDMGLSPIHLGFTLSAIVSARLVRKICPHCKVKYTPSSAELEALHLSLEDLPEGQLWKGKGCEKCGNKGWGERTGVHEVLAMNEALRRLMMDSQSREKVVDYFQKENQSLLENARQKVLEGITTVREVVRSVLPALGD